MQAVVRYNEYYNDIEKARGNIDRDSLEKELMDRMEVLGDDGKISCKRHKRQRDGELNIVDECGTPVRARCELYDLS